MMLKKNALRGLTTVGMGAAAACAHAGPPVFSDQTVAAGLDAVHQTSGFYHDDYAAGAAVGDFNRDGWPDLFVASGGDLGRGDYLYINNGDGTFTDRADEWGLTDIHRATGAAAADYDGDGWIDLFVLSTGPAGSSPEVGSHKLYRNVNGQSFVNIADVAGVAQTNPDYPDAWTCAFGDYDLDGDLDLFIGGFMLISPSNDGNRLFRNDGEGVFVDVTEQIGLFDGVGPIACLSASFNDMNGDRYPELLLVGDFKNVNGFVGSRYFLNNQDGTFTDVTEESGVGLEENGMGHARGDLNNDGWNDWYTTSIYLPDINWTGNKLYLNDAGARFTEVAVDAGVDVGGYGWGAIAVDFNHDGRLDLAETNGGDAEFQGVFSNEPSYLFMNTGDNNFVEVGMKNGFVHTGPGRAILHVDYDRDGDQDVVITANSSPITLLRNEIAGPATNWLRVTLDTTGHPGCAPDGIGAAVIAKIGDNLPMTRWLDGGAGYMGTSENVVHFGLGDATDVDILVVNWPDGTDSVVYGVEANARITLTPADGQGCVGDFNTDRFVDAADLAVLLGEWGGPGVSDLNADGTVGRQDLAALLSLWGVCPG